MEQLSFLEGEIRTRKKSAEKVIREIHKLHEELNAMYRVSSERRFEIHTPEAAADLLIPFMESLDHEEFWVVCLDNRNRVIRFDCLYKGTVNSTQIRMAEVFRLPILENATAIIVAHNHPSGDPEPGVEDGKATAAIKEAGQLLEIPLIDHLIIGRGRFVSFARRGLL
jgi:DNA repair protein RadC